MSLYLVKEDDDRLWVAYEDDARQRLYVHVGNTGKFHRNKALAADFYLDREFTYEPITGDQAATLIAEGVGRLDARTVGYQIEEYAADPEALATKTVLGRSAVADVGPSREQRAHAKAEQVRTSAPGEWVTWSTYPPEKRQTAYVAASDLRNGKVRTLAHVVEDSVDTRVVPAADIDGGWKVQVTRAESRRT